MRSTSCRMKANVIVSGSGLPPRPSASVAPGTISTRRPARTLVRNAHDASASTPITSLRASMALATVATPLINPPPPIGTTSVSVPAASSKISSATVAAPAMTSASL